MGNLAPLYDKTKTIKGWNLNDVDKTTSATVIYIGYSDERGNWLFKKIDTTADISARYATKKNNPTITTYAGAYTDRVSLDYDTYDQVW